MRALLAQKQIDWGTKTMSLIFMVSARKYVGHVRPQFVSVRPEHADSPRQNVVRAWAGEGSLDHRLRHQLQHPLEDWLENIHKKLR